MRPETVKTRGSADPGPPDGGGDETPSPADWGLDGERRGLSRETKIGLALIALLLCAFAFVVYQRIDQARALQTAVAQEADGSEAQEELAGQTEPAPPTPTPSAPLASADPFEQTFGALTGTNTRSRNEASTSPEMLQEPENSSLRSTDRSPASGEAIEDENPFATTDAPPQSEPEFAAAPSSQSSAPEEKDSESLELVDLFAQPDPAPAESPFAAPEATQQEGAPAEPSLEILPRTATAQGEAAAGDVQDPFAQLASSQTAPVDGTSDPNAGGPDELDLASQREPSQPRELPKDLAGDFLLPAEGTDAAPGRRSGAEATSSREQEMAGSSTLVRGAPDRTSSAQAQPTRRAELGQPEFDALLAPSDPARAPIEPAPVDPFAGMPTTAADPLNSASPSMYEVRPGDNFWIISRRQYGSARYYLALARFNSERVPDPQSMRPGMKLLIPPRETLEAQYPDLFPGRAVSQASENAVLTAGFHFDPTGRPLYRVGSKDTLEEIALRHLGRSSRWVQIYEMNRGRLADPHDLRIGTVLKLPADATRVETARHEE